MIPKSELKIERMRGKGPGGQHKNKTASCIRVTHIPTGVSVTKDGRHQHKNLAWALAEIGKRLSTAAASIAAKSKKAKRDVAIHTRNIVRTYDFKKGLVFDHRTNKRATVKDVLLKGNIDLLR